MTTQPIKFGSPEANLVVIQSRFLDDVRKINWIEVLDECVHVDSWRDSRLTMYRATAQVEAGGEQWEQVSDNPDRDTARINAVAALFGHMYRLALRVHRGGEVHP